MAERRRERRSELRNPWVRFQFIAAELQEVTIDVIVIALFVVGKGHQRKFVANKKW